MRALTRSALVLACLSGGGAAAAQEIGTAAAVNPASNGTPPGRALRTLTIGSRVLHNERIHTDGRGSVQLLFVDRTTMSIGPNSDVTIDEYVFDPSTNTGKLAVRLGRGVMRFVGGQVSHSGDATVTTPAASIGIRGGTGIIDVRGGRTRTINLYGRQTITAAGGQALLYRTGTMLDVSRAAGPNSAVPVSSQLLAAYNTSFQARPGQTGGRRGRLSARRVDALADTYNVTGTITPGYPGRAGYGRRPCGDPRWDDCFAGGAAWQSTLTAEQQGAQSAAAASATRIPTFTPTIPTPVTPPRLR